MSFPRRRESSLFIVLWIPVPRLREDRLHGNDSLFLSFPGLTGESRTQGAFQRTDEFKEQTVVLSGAGFMKQEITLKVNGTSYLVQVEPRRTLVEVLRENLGLMGTKVSCNEGECGACTVLMDGRPAASCLVLAIDAQHQEIVTIEGMSVGEKLHPIQEAFLQHGAIQCGFCTPGMVMSTKALLDENPKPTALEARQAISGNLCRCTGYQQIVDSVLAAAQKPAGN